MKKIAVLLLALILCAQTFTPGSRSFASTVDGIILTLSTNKVLVDSGEEFSYLIYYSTSSTFGDYADPRISFTVPLGVTFTSRADSSITTSTVTDSIAFPGQKEVTFQFKGGILPAGAAGQLVVNGKFENYVTPDGTTATTNAVFTAIENGTLVSMEFNEATVTSHASAPWSIEMRKILPIPEPFKGSDAQYEIVVKPVNGDKNGSLDIQDIVVTARLAAGAVFVSADNGGTTGPDNTVVWNLSDGLRNAKKLKLLVNFPTSISANEVTTGVEMSYTPLGGTPFTIASSVTHGFETSPKDAETSFNLYAVQREISHGQTVKWNLSGLSNKSNVALYNSVLEILTPTHTISGTPIALELQSVKMAAFSGIATYEVYYTLTEDPAAVDWMQWTTTNASTSTTLNATELGTVKGIQVRFETLPINWSQESDFEFTYKVPSDFPVPLSSSEIIRSSANYYYVFDGATKKISDDSETSIVMHRPLLELQNTVSQPSAAPSETVTYTLSVTNHDQLSSDKLDNPVIYNMLPADLEYVPNSLMITKPAGLPLDPMFTAEPQASGETKLTWSWDEINPGVLLIGEKVQIQFKAKIRPGTQLKTVMNTFGVESLLLYLNDVNYSNHKTPINTPSNTPADGFYRVEATSSMTVTSSAALQSRLWVKGELDASWSETTGSTTPGGQALYRLEIQNIGNVPMKGLTIVNPFPRIGDTAVLNGSVPRGSQWGPVLMGAVDAPSYVTVFYSTTSGISMNPTTGVDNGVWTADLPADPTSVTAIKLIFDPYYVMDPLNTTTLEWAMRAPVGAPTGGEIAWNSYAYRVKTELGQSLLPAEPNKVGIKIQSSPKAEIGDFVWLDSNENGLQDAGESGLNGVTVELYDAIGNKLAETVTSNNFIGQPGAYLFPNLEPGEYRVVFKLASSYEAVNPKLVTLEDGEKNSSLNAGLVLKKGKIGHYVWVDTNENGLQDAGESGLNGIKVHLYNGSGKLATTTSATHNGQDGHYVFDNLNPGNYQVEFVLPSVKYGFTGKTVGADPTIDSDADPATGKTSVFSLAQGEENLTVDAGIIQLPPSGAQTATASPATLTPVAGANNTVTLTVYDELGNTDTNFNGDYNVTISGAEQAPKGSYGSFAGTAISSGSQTISVSFTNGVATPILALHKADEQTIGFSITGVATPATNTQTITPSVGSLSAMELTQDIVAPTASGGQFAQQPKVALVDAYGNIRTGDNSTQVTVVKKDAGAWTLTGTTTVTASAGVATFSDLGATNAEQVTGVKLAFQTGTLTEITSSTVTLPWSSLTVPNIISVTAGDGHAAIGWNGVYGSVSYAVYQREAHESYGAAIATVDASILEYDALGLTNGTTYYFMVKAINPAGVSDPSNEVSATPMTVPSAPTEVRAVGGNGQATITFTAPDDQGGSPITGYEVTVLPDQRTVTGHSSSITITGLTNGSAYTFIVKAINSVGLSTASVESNAVTPYSPSSDNNDASPPARSTTEVEVLVNGKREKAGIAATTEKNGRTIMTVTLDSKKLGDRLQAEGSRSVITIPFSTPSDAMIGVLNGQMIKDMEIKQQTIEIKTEKATYTIPALQINIDAISEQIGRDVKLEDIQIEIEISEPTEEQLKIVENAVHQGAYTLVVPPLNFSVRGSYGDVTVDVSKFNAYVSRTFAIPYGVDPNKITTGVVVDPDGTVRHVPTTIERIDGKYYATINSLTNSTYALIWKPVVFKDVVSHWAEKAVNEMGSRLVVSGIGSDLYNPNQAITRAEFAAIIVRAMGLKENRGVTPFSDVRSSDWYSGAVLTALDYGLISGYEDGTFRPQQRITREQAMVMIARAMEVTGLRNQLPAQDSNKILQSYDDAKQVSLWARDSVADVLKAGIITGRSNSQLAPQALISRAEVAVIIQRLLQQSKLI
ncbi:MAG: SdrD B-like domain-containing protein [Candidatus Cohnella colombiensis]|uniref:SdrD B-like domain-containing protein n=1 Tax=Candidatus Cohnella colombiensis TaxID=3121368 RepID=A0AA95F505_9BACL|nr:MAG: SdrD B-like domain-containing protein [Cohnella sp.]